MKNKVSIIMGIYNIPSKDILKKSINSILNQTYKNIEFIIIDDGSKNDTYKWAKELTENDKRVILKRNEKNLGLTKTLNKALSLATGKYIARMDGDDCSELNRIKKQVHFLENNKDFSLVACNVNLFDENGIWGERKFNKVIKKEDFLFTSPIIHPTILTYKWCYDLINGYTEKWYTDRNEDYDLFMRMYSKGIRMFTIQEKLFNYREDDICYSKRKYRYRICELIVRTKGFMYLKLYPKALPYVVKPLIVGLIPQSILRKLRMKKNDVALEND